MQRFKLLLKVSNASCYLQGAVMRPFFMSIIFYFYKICRARRNWYRIDLDILKTQFQKNLKMRKYFKKFETEPKKFFQFRTRFATSSSSTYFQVRPVRNWERTRKGFDLNYLTNTYKYSQILLEFTCQFATLGILIITLGV